jgi:hypothetical protein
MNSDSLLRFLLLILVTFPRGAQAQKQKFLERRKEVLRTDTNFYFYHRELNHGVQSLMNPAFVIANNGFDIL